MHSASEVYFLDYIDLKLLISSEWQSQSTKRGVLSALNHQLITKHFKIWFSCVKQDASNVGCHNSIKKKCSVFECEVLVGKEGFEEIVQWQPTSLNQCRFSVTPPSPTRNMSSYTSYSTLLHQSTKRMLQLSTQPFCTAHYTSDTSNTNLLFGIVFLIQKSPCPYITNSFSSNITTTTTTTNNNHNTNTNNNNDNIKCPNRFHNDSAPVHKACSLKTYFPPLNTFGWTGMMTAPQASSSDKFSQMHLWLNEHKFPTVMLQNLMVSLLRRV